MLSMVLMFAAFVFLVFAACTLWVPSKPQWFDFCEKIPRGRWSGSVLTVLVCALCVPNIQPIIDPGGFLYQWLLPLMLLGAVICIVYLDFLFARAFGALLILLAHYLLKETYPQALPLQWWFASVFVILGTFGICICAKPYWMRDWIRAAFQRPKMRVIQTFFWFAAGSSCAIAALQIMARS